MQYADFAVWQRGWLRGEALDAQLAYWTDRLADVPVLDLPTDRPRPPVRSSAGGVVEFEVPEATVDGLRAVARAGHATMFMTLLAAFDVLLARSAGQEDIVVGSPVANRDRAETLDVVGFFTNTLVIRTDLSGAPDFRALLKRVRETTLGAYAHQDLPFARLVSALRPGSGAEEMPLFRVVFELEHARAAHETLRLPEAEVVSLPRAPGARRTLRSELRLTMLDAAARIGGTLWYRTELFDADTIDRMIRGYLALLEDAAAHPDRPVPKFQRG